MQGHTIDVPATHVRNGTALVPAESRDRALETRSANPLDLPKAQFAKALKRREENRKHLMERLWANLVEGVDYGRIHVVKRKECPHDGPPNCTYANTPQHWSKQSLRKPGAEKICGFLGMTAVFPTLPDYEKLAISGAKLETIILRCHIIGPDGSILADGIGGRSVSYDYGDVNKAMKMAEKSAHIDATLRAAGLSEIFTQDLEDMQALEEAQRQEGLGAPAQPSEPPKVKGPEDLFGFGKKHYETKIADLPPDYIRWVLDESNMSEAAKSICRAERTRRDQPQYATEQREAKIATATQNLQKNGPWTGEELVPGTVARFGLQPWRLLEAKLIAWLAANSKSEPVRKQAAKEIERRDLDRGEVPYAPAEIPATSKPARAGAEADFDDDIPY